MFHKQHIFNIVYVWNTDAVIGNGTNSASHDDRCVRMTSHLSVERPRPMRETETGCELLFSFQIWQQIESYINVAWQTSWLHFPDSQIFFSKQEHYNFPAQGVFFSQLVR